VTGSSDGFAILWDAGDDSAPLQIFDVGQSVRSVAISPDGSRIVTGLATGRSKLWDIDDGITPLRIYYGHSSRVNSVEFSPDGQTILTGSVDNSAKLWDIDNGVRPLKTYLGHTDDVFTAEFARDGAKVMTASSNGTLVWDPADDTQPTQRLPMDLPSVERAVFSPAGSTFLTRNFNENGPKLWNIGDPSGPIRRFEILDAKLGTTDFSPDGTMLIASCSDGTAKIWNVNDETTPIRVFDGHDGDINDATFTPDGTGLLTVGSDKMVNLWDIDDNTTPIRSFALPGRGLQVAVSPDGATMAALYSGGHGYGQIWDINDNSAPRGHIVESPRGGQASGELSCSNSGVRVGMWASLFPATGTFDDIFLAEFHSGDDSDSHPYQPWYLRDSDDSPNLAELWDSTYVTHPRVSQYPTRVFDMGSSVKTVDISPDGTKALTGGAVGTVLWDLGYARIDDISRPGYEVFNMESERKLYGDRDYRFEHDIPEYFENQLLIRTLNDDKAFTEWNFLRFNVDRPVTVYVVYDARVNSPPWWLAWWPKLDDTLETTDTQGPGRVIYTRDFPPGRIILGPNRDPGMPGFHSMYNVIVAVRDEFPSAAEANWEQYR